MGEDSIHGTVKEVIGKTHMGRNGEGGRGRPTWDGTVKGKGKTYMGQNSEGEEEYKHGTEQ